MIQAVETGTATPKQTCILRQLVIHDRQRVANTGANADRLRAHLTETIHRLGSLACPGQEQNESNLNVARAFRMFAPVDLTAGEILFQRALELAPSDEARADYLYARETKGFGGGGCALALEVYPMHGPCLFQTLSTLGRRIGRRQSLEGRFAYWCLADPYRQLGASVPDHRIAGAARRAAAHYERAGPSRAHSRAAGYMPVQTVVVPLADGQTCRTPIR